MTAEPEQARRARIELLPPEVAARIAAGEVIERPASVVKELAENALDAGASVVEVEIEGGGRDRIRVRDDGHGIPPEQLADAFERHATSKLRSERELFTVRTLGFRGEALAAIAAAADVDLVTRPAEEGAAAVARYRDGRPDGRGAAAAAGTSVEVRDLFAALPARRRFLRTARAEGRAVAQVISELAIAHPAVAFRLRSDGRSVLSTAGGGGLVEAVAAVHGAEVVAALLAVEGRREAEGASVEVGGAAAAPSTHRATRRTLLVVANGRTVRAPAIAHAVERAYEGLLPAGRHPVAFLRVDVPLDQIDVNVHPTKAEVRFRQERLVHAAVGAAVREALLEVSAAAGPPLAGPALPATPRAAAVAPGADRRSVAVGGRGVLAAARAAPPASAASLQAQPAQGALPLRERLPALRPLGQVGRTYLAAEAPDGLYLVDQHAAHERVRYDELTRQRRTRAAEPQPLLQAAVAPLSAALLALAQEQAEELRALGWELDATDGAALLVRAVPASLADGDPARALADYLDRLEAEQGLSAPDRVAAALACRAAVRAGDRLDGEQQRALLRSLERTEAPLTCPHGRPTVLHLSSDALERSFGRR